MKYNFSEKTKQEGLLIVPAFKKGSDTYSETFQDAVKKGLVKEKDFKAHSIFEQGFERITIIYLGKKSEVTPEKIRKYASKIATLCNRMDRKHAQVLLNQDFMTKKLCFSFAESIGLSTYEFTGYKEKQSSLESLHIVIKNSFEKEFNKGLSLAKATNYARDLINHPANVMNSTRLDQEAKKIGELGAAITVLEQEDLEKKGLRGLLSVNKGSAQPPKLILIHHKGKDEDPTLLVGKGITFDTGGYSIKPNDNMVKMKSDMAGAAAVMGTLRYLVENNVKRNVVGVVPICENMISSDANRPSDIVKMYNGKTVEITNTDAEGRLILADALSYSEEKFAPKEIIDIATLTGSVIVALGKYCSGMISKDDNMAKKLELAGLESNDKVWRLPFFDDYQNDMDGDVSDLRNTGKNSEAGAITAGVFLSKFVKTNNWVHLDIAGSGRSSKDRDYVKEGGTGAGVRLLSYYLEKY